MLSKYLASRVGKGFSETNLQSVRKFCRVYSPSIKKLHHDFELYDPELQKQQTMSAELNKDQALRIQQSLSVEFNPFRLGWSHYQILMRIENADERHFYVIEAISKNPSVYHFLIM